jgi:hypothetical protein
LVIFLISVAYQVHLALAIKFGFRKNDSRAVEFGFSTHMLLFPAEESKSVLSLLIYYWWAVDFG